MLWLASKVPGSAGVRRSTSCLLRVAASSVRTYPPVAEMPIALIAAVQRMSPRPSIILPWVVLIAVTLLGAIVPILSPIMVIAAILGPVVLGLAWRWPSVGLLGIIVLTSTVFAYDA